MRVRIFEFANFVSGDVQFAFGGISACCQAPFMTFLQTQDDAGDN